MIKNAGTLTINNSILQNNKGSIQGVAIKMLDNNGANSNSKIILNDGAIIQDNNSTISGNYETGAIILNRGELVMNTGSKVTKNITSGHGAGIDVSGGISDAQPTLLTINGGEISYNETAFQGGGIRVLQYGKANITNATITHNKTTNETRANGAGISINTGKMEITNSIITNNDSVRYAGGIDILRTAEVTIKNCTIRDNDSSRRRRSNISRRWKINNNR